MTLQKALQKSDSSTSASNLCCLGSQEFSHQLNWCSLSVVAPILKALQESPGVRWHRDHRDAQKETDASSFEVKLPIGFPLIFFSPKALCFLFSLTRRGQIWTRRIRDSAF